MMTKIQDLTSDSRLNSRKRTFSTENSVWAFSLSIFRPCPTIRFCTDCMCSSSVTATGKNITSRITADTKDRIIFITLPIRKLRAVFCWFSIGAALRYGASHVSLKRTTSLLNLL